MDRLSDVMYPPSVGKFRPDQIANRATWDSVPDAPAQAAQMHYLAMVRKAATTETFINPLDPGDTVADWSNPPADWGRLAPIGRR